MELHTIGWIFCGNRLFLSSLLLFLYNSATIVISLKTWQVLLYHLKNVYYSLFYFLFLLLRFIRTLWNINCEYKLNDAADKTHLSLTSSIIDNFRWILSTVAFWLEYGFLISYTFLWSSRIHLSSSNCLMYWTLSEAFRWCMKMKWKISFPCEYTTSDTELWVVKFTFLIDLILNDFQECFQGITHTPYQSVQFARQRIIF